MVPVFPDIDGIIDIIQYPLDFSTTRLQSLVGHNRYIHSIGGIVLVSLLAGVILFRLGQPFAVSAAATGIGFITHLLEDALAYNPAGSFFWPLSEERSGLRFSLNIRATFWESRTQRSFF
ncbi:MAG: metal-dependent hydrolase [Methanomicrobiales archaeon]|nr:metal-dependent hydrolase [Methanomicrobiales archaeon]